LKVQQLPILIAFTYLAWALLIPLIAALRKNWIYPFTLVGSAISACASIYGFISSFGSEPLRYTFGGWAPPLGVEFIYDSLSSFILMVINTIAFLVLIHSKGVADREFPEKKMPYYALVMLFMLGLNGITLTGDIFTLFVFLEISSLSSYGLMSVGKKFAVYTAFRYLIIGSIGGSLYLLGVFYLYTVTGTLNMADIAAMIPQVATQPGIVTGIILIVAGFGIKAALFPMHGWLPDLYAQANSTSSALVAPIGTKVAAYVLIRLLLLVFGINAVDAVAPISTIIGILASIGIIYGSIYAIRQTQLKRMLAYSSVSQIGYVLLGLSLANPMGFRGAVLHILNHAIMKACLFLVAANLEKQEGHSDLSKFNKSFAKKYPWSMLAFTLAALSMIGLPPLAGFFSKWYLAVGAVEGEQSWYLIVILASSLLNAAYFFRIIERIYIKPADDTPSSQNDVAFSMLLPTLILALGLLVVGLMNTTLLSNLLPFYD